MSALSSIEIEASVLGCALLDKDALFRIVPLLSPDDFSLGSHRRIYHTVLGLANAGEAVDDLTVVDALVASGQLEAVARCPKRDGWNWPGRQVGLPPYLSTVMIEARSRSTNYFRAPGCAFAGMECS